MNTNQIIFIFFVIAAFGFFGYTVNKIIKVMGLTKKLSRFDHIAERIKITLLVALGQSKMMKRPLAGVLHAVVWWGFLVITIGTLEMIIDGISNSERIFSFLGGFYSLITASGEIFAALIIISCVIFLIRRYLAGPKRFTGIEMKPGSRLDATVILSLIIILMVSLIGMNTGYVNNHSEIYGYFPVSRWMVNTFPVISTMDLHTFETTNWWIHIVIVLVFLNILPYSKHFHVIMAVPNVFFTRLEPKARLNNMKSVTKEIKILLNPDTASAPSADAVPSRFGVKDAEDVSWKNLLDGYTCTECGRCTAVCPANITGKKLSPRKLLIDLRKRMNDKEDGLLKDKNFSDGKSLISEDYISQEELWACTTCMACIEECPVNIDHVPFIVDMRRSLVMEDSKMPTGWTLMMNNIENNGSPWQFSRSDRYKWAENGIETSKQ